MQRWCPGRADRVDLGDADPGRAGGEVAVAEPAGGGGELLGRTREVAGCTGGNLPSFIACRMVSSRSFSLSYTGSANLLVRYLNQGRAQAERASPPPRRLVSWIMTRPADLTEHEAAHLKDLLAACPHLTVLVEQVRAFADLLTARRSADLEDWMTAVEDSDLPALQPSSAGYVRTSTPSPPG